VLLRVRDLKQDEGGQYTVEYLDENNRPEEMVVSGDDAVKILTAFNQNEFDLKRYAGAPPEFPVPDSIPVEIDGPEAGVRCHRCGHAVNAHSQEGCTECRDGPGRCTYTRDQAATRG
jgi:hypothetical protein